MLKIKQEYIGKIKWFGESPDAGEPNCHCSYCGDLISEEEVPIRFFNTIEMTEARFHEVCFLLIAE